MDFREVETENKDIVEEVVADVETAEENVDEPADSYDDSKHGKERTHLVGFDSLKRHYHIFN